LISDEIHAPDSARVFQRAARPRGLRFWGTHTQDEVDEHYARAKAAGAEIVYDIRDEDHGGRAYSCRDPEGYIWHFGSYDPWKADH
jgi:uncharacterized glyoxalase superfamily protein PhnB